MDESAIQERTSQYNIDFYKEKYKLPKVRIPENKGWSDAINNAMNAFGYTFTAGALLATAPAGAGAMLTSANVGTKAAGVSRIASFTRYNLAASAGEKALSYLVDIIDSTFPIITDAYRIEGDIKKLNTGFIVEKTLNSFSRTKSLVPKEKEDLISTYNVAIGSMIEKNTAPLYYETKTIIDKEYDFKSDGSDVKKRLLNDFYFMHKEEESRISEWNEIKIPQDPTEIFYDILSFETTKKALWDRLTEYNEWSNTQKDTSYKSSGTQLPPSLQHYDIRNRHRLNKM